MESKLVSNISLDVASRALDVVFAGVAARKAQRERREAAADQLRKGLEAHQQRVLNWSEALNVYGLGLRRDDTIEAATAPLDFTLVPRRFRPLGAEAARELGELDLLARVGHTLVEAAPGAGKTTSMKRLARRVLLDEPTSPTEPSVVIAVALREYPGATRIVDVITTELLIDETVALVVSLLDPGALAPLTAANQRQQSEREGQIVERDEAIGEEQVTQPTVEERRQAAAIASILDALNALVILDGLDETHNGLSLVHDIELVASYSAKMRMLVTCRTGYFSRPLANFRSLEICELSTGQIESIVSRYLFSDGQAFIGGLNDNTRELASRPLFLMQMMLLFDRFGSVPDEPSQLCRSLIRFSLREWDADRRVKRVSNYSKFDVDRKIDFLAALAFELFQEEGIQMFSEEVLRQCYRNLAPAFGLPVDEVREVVSELETHTGIIQTAGTGYEFCHLTMQEYLAGEHLTRLPDRDAPSLLVEKFPSVVAAAVALSSDPTTILADVVLRRSDPEQRQSTLAFTPAIPTFLTRLTTESPPLDPHNPRLGIAMIRAMVEFPSWDEVLEAIVRLPNLAEATRSSLSRFYRWAQTGDPEQVKISLNDSPDPPTGAVPSGFIPRKWFDLLSTL